MIMNQLSKKEERDSKRKDSGPMDENDKAMAISNMDNPERAKQFADTFKPA